MTKIIILAAGKGSRMNQSLPKVLTELSGKAIIEYLLKNVTNSGIDDKPIIVVSDDNIKQIQEQLKDYNLEYAIQDKQLGTGHAVKFGLKSIKGDVEKVIVLYGDHPFIKKESLFKLNDIKTNSVTLMPIRVPDYNSWRYNTYHWGRIIRNEKGKILKITEYKDASDKEKEIKEINPGIMAFNYQWLQKNIDKLNNNNNKSEYYLTDLTSIAVDNDYEVNSVNMNPKESIGINTSQELELAKKLIT